VTDALQMKKEIVEVEEIVLAALAFAVYCAILSRQ
jgi:hypothetical protein